MKKYLKKQKVFIYNKLNQKFNLEKEYLLLLE